MLQFVESYLSFVFFLTSESMLIRVPRPIEK